MKTYMKKAFLMLICLMAGWANGVGAKVTDDESAIRLDSMQVSGNMLAGMTQQATVNMSNIGSDDYEGYWYLFEQASPTEPKVLLSGTSVTASAGGVNVKVSSTDGLRPRGGDVALTSGMDFTGMEVNLVDSPDWVKCAMVVDGNIVLKVKTIGFAILIR